MKNYGKVIGLFCALLMVLSLAAGCGANTSGEVQEEVQEEVQDVQEEAVELEQEVKEQAGEAVQSNDSAGSAAKEIGEDAALKIALEDAGLSKSDVSRIQCELDYDDGRTEYEIEFHKGMTEYSYTLDAFSGKILEKEIDNDDD